MTTRYKKVPPNVTDERFPPHVEVELQELSEEKQRKGEAVGEEVITMKNVAHKVLKDVSITTDGNRIPHGLGSVPSDYTVIVKKPTKFQHVEKGYFIQGGQTQTIYHGLNREPIYVLMTRYTSSGGIPEIAATYSGNTEYIQVKSGVFGTPADILIYGGSPNWIQSSASDNNNLYLRSVDCSLTVDIIVRE